MDLEKSIFIVTLYLIIVSLRGKQMAKWMGNQAIERMNTCEHMYAHN